MWYFVSPQVVFGEGALDALDELEGQRALIVTDPVIIQLGLVERVQVHLERAGFDVRVFSQVEPDPSVQTAQRGAEVAAACTPDWIVGLGGGSVLDAAKAIWVLYERTDLEPGEINPFVRLNLRQKARLVTIPTTSGTGADVTWAIVLTDTDEQRKMGLGNRENVADMAIVDPSLAVGMPPQLTSDTGLDALVHAIEGYTCTWHNDFTDGLCLNAARLVMTYLPRAVADGSDVEARERLHNAATCAGLGFGNAMASMAHAMGHALGAIFHLPHGRAVGICLPYTVEFAAREAPKRFADLARFLQCATSAGEEGARSLVAALRDLYRQIGVPTSLAEAGIERSAFDAQLDKLVDDAFNDTQMITAVRSPSYEELRRLFEDVYAGRVVAY